MGSINPINAAPADPHRPADGVDEETELFARLSETEDPAERDAIWNQIWELMDSRPVPPSTYIRPPLSDGKFSTTPSPAATTPTALEGPCHKGFTHSAVAVENAAPIVHIPSPSPSIPSLSPTIPTSKPNLEIIRRNIAQGLFRYRSSTTVRKRHETRWKNIAEAARQAEIRATGPFEGLEWIEQINAGRDYFQAEGCVWSGTWLLDMPTIALLRKPRDETPLSWLTSRARRALRKALGRHPAFIATMQINDAGFEHLHVIIELALEEVDVAEKALTTKGCFGKWKTRPAWKRRGDQIDLNPLCDDGWTGYITRHRKQLARGDFYMAGEFRDAAVQHHDAKRRALATPQAGHDSEKPREADLALVDSHPTPARAKPVHGLPRASGAGHAGDTGQAPHILRPG